MIDLRRIWKRTGGRNTYAQIWIYFVTACIGILLVSTLFLYFWSSGIIMREVADYSEEILAGGAANTSAVMRANVDYVQKSSMDSSIRSYAIQTTASPYRNYLAWQSIKDLKDKNRYIDSIFVINDYTSTVVDTRFGVTALGTFYDQEIIDLLRGWQMSSQPFVVPRYVATDYITPVRARLISVIIPYEIGESISAFVVNFDSDALLSLFQRDSGRGGNIFVLDQNGVIISSSDPSAFLHDFAELSIPDRFTGERGWFENRSNESDYIVVYANVAFLGSDQWTIVETIPKSSLLLNLYKLRNVTQLFFLAVFVLTLLAIWRITRRIYSPIQELIVRATAQRDKIDAYSREIKYLEKEEILRAGLLAPPGKPYEMNHAALALSPRNLAIVLFRIDRYRAFVDTYSERDRRLLRFGMSNIAQDHLKQFAGVEAADMGDDHVVVLFNVQDEEALAAMTGRIVQCQTYIRQYLGIGTTAVIGPYLENIMELGDSYRETLERAGERFLSGAGALITGSGPAGAGRVFRYPEDKERTLLQAVKKGNAETVTATLAEIRDLFKKASYPEAKLSATNLLWHIGQTVRDLPLRQDHPFDWSLSDIEQQLAQLETLDAAFDWLGGLLGRYMEDLTAPGLTSRNAQLIAELKRQIERRIDDPNLSAKMLSDELGLSVNYIRNVFKSETNQSILDCITERRLDNAAAMMRATALSIDDIAVRSGFVSPVSFYAIFKKHFGTTPAAYRRTAKKAQE